MSTMPLDSLIQILEELVNGLPANGNEGGGDAEASAAEEAGQGAGGDQGSKEAFGGEDEGEDGGQGEKLTAEGATTNDDSPSKAKIKRPRQVKGCRPILFYEFQVRWAEMTGRLSGVVLMRSLGGHRLREEVHGEHVH